MPDSTWTLKYAGEEFRLTHNDAEKLSRTLNERGGELFLWKFIPSDSDTAVSITVGVGIPLILVKNPELA